MNITEGLNALHDVQAICPDAVLAGGYLRDSSLHRDVKDIDIFVPTMSVAQLQVLEQHASPMLGAAAYMEQTEVKSIWNLPGYRFPVQVIELAPGLDPVDRAKAHDFGICQVWHDGTEAWFTSAFLRDRYSLTFTLVDCATKADYDRSMRRWDRLKGKFPDFRLVVPEKFQVFA